MRYLVYPILLLFIVFPLFAGADFYSPRSLALGMGGLSFSYDFSALYHNPALLASFPFSVSGLSYQNRYGDLLDMERNLSGLVREWRNRGADQVLSPQGQSFKDALTESGSALHGFDARIPAMLLKNFGLGVARIKSAYMTPLYASDGALSLGEDEAPLFHSVGLDYTQYSLAYAMPLGQTLFLGTTAHFLSGKLGLATHSLSDPFFDQDRSVKEYISRITDESEQKFSKILFHFGLIWKVAETLDVSLTVENFGSPTLFSEEESGKKIELPERYRASFSFRPTMDWGFYADADLRKSKVYPGFDQERQPVSIGIEKGFFQNTAFLRIGLYTDISRTIILGEKSAMALSFGAGLRVGAILVDAGLILNGNGSVNGLAIAGYYVVN